ncbi:squalene/phytoene synthase family protein [Ruegeria sp. 2012CJ41-6]|uniref:Squalene/phytoene synthase family protein n=1 Tax=Ruegeria spongiae TaxID=2942209 RepID=A0ABT0PX20_9RHOB|nr:squalene/phytoene synthase family protein [Ruegeria spongiae]MCL6281922.1 squalene/phytoene synthase family protein [Ruegeria spongiae]
MSFDADLTACAALVEKGDPERFLAAMAAPVAARRVLFPLYALNVEVARAPWVTQEPMIAEMRLQWWRDVLQEIAEGQTVRRHQVVTPLAAILSPELATYLDQYVSVRRWDIYKDPFEDAAHLTAYLDHSAGSLMVAAAQSLGPADTDVVRDFGYAAGVANWLVAVPELEARGRIPLLDGTAEGVRALARTGLDRLDRARRGRAAVSAAARPALLAGWQTEALLKQAVAEPGLVASGALGQSGFRKRTGLMWQAATGRW